MANRVRYLTISRVAVELMTSLSDRENAEFIRILFSCFQQLENGQKPDYTETESPLLNFALREAVSELETGYRNYSQRVNARKKASSDTETTVNHRSTADQSPIDHRTTIEEKREEEKRKEECRVEGMQGETENLLLSWSRAFLSAADYRTLEKYLSEGGETEQARLAIHRWKDNGKNGCFTDYIER